MSNAYRSSLAGGGAAVGDATAADVLTGKTFSGAVGSGVSGTMPNQGAVSGVATPTQPYTIPAGYHNGSGSVTADAPEIKEALTSNARNVSILKSDGTTVKASAMPSTTDSEYFRWAVDGTGYRLLYALKPASYLICMDAGTGDFTTVTLTSSDTFPYQLSPNNSVSSYFVAAIN